MADLPHYEESTLNLFADLICGNSANGEERGWYKKGIELPGYFRSAGLECIDFDASETSSRKAWVKDRLSEYQDDPSHFVKAITHVAHPTQHRERIDDARKALEYLNGILAADGLKAVYDGGFFRLEGEEFVFHPDAEPLPSSVEPLDITGLISDAELAQIVQARFDEAARARSSGAHLSTVIMLGAGLEGLLIGFARSRLATAMRSQVAPEVDGTKKHIGDWKLSELINVAHDANWIQKDARDFGQNVRDFRNLVHPYKEYRDKFEPTDEGTCGICWAVISAVVDDLQKVIEQEQRSALATAAASP